jgi:hypothetical protein
VTQEWTYQIKVRGRIGERWLHWFDGMSVMACGDPPGATTTLAGTVADQAALLGLLQRLYTLGLPLLLVRQVGPADE